MKPSTAHIEPEEGRPMKKNERSVAQRFGYLHVGEFIRVGKQSLAWAILDEPYTSPTRALHITRDGRPVYETRFNYTGDFQSDGTARARARWNNHEDPSVPISPIFKIRPDGTRVA
ncbi:MAG TPA: hypothetical protein VJG64_01190 [Candidatus Paceibacterota bacterium]